MSFVDWFRGHEAAQDDALQRGLAVARECLAWAEAPYHTRFVQWLEHEASRPLHIDQTERNLVAAAVRSNTFREVLARVQSEIQASRDTIEAFKGE